MAVVRTVLLIATLLWAVSCCLGLPWVDSDDTLEAIEERIERDTSGTKQCSVTTTCITSGQSGISALTQITVPEDDPDACNAMINNIRRENPGCDVTSDCC
eukprot:Em0007g828a